MEEPILIRFNLQHVHGGLQPLALLALVHIAEQALNIAQGRQGYRAAEEVHVLLQHAYVVTAPGQQHIILTAPSGKLIHGLQEGRGIRQFLRPQMGHALNAGMNLHIVLRMNGDGNAVHHPKPVIHLHRTDLDHLEDQPISYLPINLALIV